MYFLRSVFFLAILSLNFGSGTSLLVSSASAKDKRDEINYYKRWVDEDVLYIITDDEKATFNALRNDEERENFIEQFWFRRNPTQRPGDNPFREEHYRRIAYANQHFASGIPGWKTDRGMIYIKYGPPDEIESHPTGGRYYREDYEGGGSTSTFPFEKWWYRHIDGFDGDVEIEFVDPSFSGEYRIAMNPDEKDALINVPGAGLTRAEELGLSDKRDRLSFTPTNWFDYDNPVTWGLRSKDSPFSRMEQYFNVQRPPQIKFEDLKVAVSTRVTYNPLKYRVRTDYLRLSEDKVLVPITVNVSNQDLQFKKEYDVNRAKVNVYGVVTTLTGRIAWEFEEEIAAEFSDENFETGKNQTSQFQKMISLPPGQRYKLDLVLKDVNSERMGPQTIPISTPSYDGEKLQASSLILARSVKPAPQNLDKLDQYILGDLKVVPKVNLQFYPNQNLIPYVQIYNVEIDQTTMKPSLEVTYVLKKGKDAVAVEKDLKGASIQLFSGARVVLLTQIPLKNIIPGEYTLEISVLDAIANTTHTVSTNFKVVKPDPEHPEAELN
jgi:GWxTD domain-containing protein